MMTQWKPGGWIASFLAHFLAALFAGLVLYVLLGEVHEIQLKPRTAKVPSSDAKRPLIQ